MRIHHFNHLMFLAKILLVSVVIGLLIATIRHGGVPSAVDLVEGALSGLLIGLGCTLTELLSRTTRRGSILRRLPLAVLVLLRALAFSFFIVVGLTLPIWLISDVVIWDDPGFLYIFGMSVLIAALISTIIEVTRLLGSEATLSLLTGRYRQPRVEDRIVLVADLVGSTALAERIGDLRFHEFLGDVALDLAGPIETARGDVHRYVGDAVFVTWRLQQKGVANAALRCAADMHRALAKAAPRYRSDFGSAPHLRIAIHCGPLAAGEIGDWKKEIALLGDTMNTAARIEGAARDIGAKTAVSDDMATLLSDDARTSLTLCSGYAAHGKSASLTLWMIAEDHRSVTT